MTRARSLQGRLTQGRPAQPWLWQRRWADWGRLWGSGFGAAVLLGLAAPWAQAQTAEFPPCPPPAASEYLLLVRGQSEAERSRVQNLLPSNSTVLVCRYLNDTVVRAGGFSSLESANAWAQYMSEIEGLQAFVARPATAAEQTAAPPAQPALPVNPTATAPAPPATAGSSSQSSAGPASAYAPRPLGVGFAVLVDYQNRPEAAASIQQSIGQAVGLAVYRQRPYLLIAHSPNVEGAASTLTVLSSKSIAAFIVDSRDVVMLTNAVAVPD